MTYFTVRLEAFFYIFSRLCCVGALAFFYGCAANTIDEAVPTSVVNHASAPQSAASDQHYPNINIVPTGATPQLSDEQTAATRATLEEAALVQQRRSESPEAYLERLKKMQKLGSTHADATLKQIEQSQ